MTNKKRIKIYTKYGDQGYTALFHGGKVLKTDARVCAYGTVDELNSCLGWVLVEVHRTLSNFSHENLEDETVKGLKKLQNVIVNLQNELFQLGSDLALPLSSNKPLPFPRIDLSNVKRLEKWIDAFDEQLPPLSAFILPGGSELAARLHIARAVSRRAEREIVNAVNLLNTNQKEVNESVIPYINRISDLLFVLARYSNFCLHVEDVFWSKTFMK
ncbi:MAG: cob(I)yrinic acid a,c-diamide adenosyltransferase [bacterium]|nr:cob(I)yrinic acid a,c-diamide adenosyltransferase [bacterium]